MSLIIMTLLPLIWLFVKSLSLRALIYVVTYALFFLTTKLLYLNYNLYLDAFYPLIGLLFSAIVSESLLYKKQEKEIGFIKDAFSSYLSPELLKVLVENPTSLKLGGEKKELTIFFSDIRNFTAMSEKMDAEDLTHYLNLYFTPMSDIVTKHNGMIDKYIGDALMAFYNAPVDVKDHAVDACKTALEMIRVLEVLNRTFKAENLPEIEIGIGINTAEVSVGNMGSKQRFNYTVIGDGVNIASRVESLTKVYGVKILITENTKKQISEGFLVRELERIKVRGKEEAVMLYELLENTNANQEMVEKYSVALAHYNEGRIEEANALFSDLAASDNVSKYFLNKVIG